eukprot:TRINITY_DN4483_c0_g1_i3.p1 TRINITY_DN4483_c0_g1~~TRINITY_DN4483_c0_g1_i3.p1  ORF type:complete len:111 (-),score=14.01 TRINITY_DN4483_c0_g1_i3:69-401(-)
MTGLPNPPSFIEYKHYKFLIFDAPTDANLEVYLKEMKKHKVTHLARACDPSYQTEKLEENGIQVHELCFPDGGFPQDSVVHEWLEVCHDAFKDKHEPSSIAVHCVAGLGR